MPRLSGICATAVLLLTLSATASAVEKWVFVHTADAVVVGQLKLSSYFLSFDGIHVNGTIRADEILYGDGHAGQGLEYHMVLPCSLWRGCDYRAVFANWSSTKELLTRKRIWALVKGQGSLWTVGDQMLFPVYDLSDRERVLSVLKERKQSDHDRPKP